MKRDMLKLAGLLNEEFKTPAENYAYKSGYLYSIIKKAKADLEFIVTNYRSLTQELEELSGEKEYPMYAEQAFKSLGEKVNETLNNLNKNLERVKSELGESI